MTVALGYGPGSDPGLAPIDARGATTIPSSVVARIAEQAASEVTHVGRAAGGILDRGMRGAGARGFGARGSGSRAAEALGVGALGLGGRGDFDSRPSATCDLYGTVAVLSLDVGIAFPVSLDDACRRLRSHVRDRVESLTGLDVGRMDIEVSWLHPASGTRGELE